MSQPATGSITKHPSENAREAVSIEIPIRLDVRESSGVEGRALDCPKCGSSDTIKKGDSIPNAKGEIGKRIICNTCGRRSTIR